MGIGFMARYLAASLDQVHVILPDMPMPSLPIWLTVHREIRTSPRIRAVYDALAQAVPQALQAGDAALERRSWQPPTLQKP
jgi:DNA-binding transcriptional LysR family regulator